MLCVDCGKPVQLVLPAKMGRCAKCFGMLLCRCRQSSDPYGDRLTADVEVLMAERRVRLSHIVVPRRSGCKPRLQLSA